MNDIYTLIAKVGLIRKTNSYSKIERNLSFLLDDILEKRYCTEIQESISKFVMRVEK